MSIVYVMLICQSAMCC